MGIDIIVAMSGLAVFILFLGVGGRQERAAHGWRRRPAVAMAAAAACVAAVGWHGQLEWSRVGTLVVALATAAILGLWTGEVLLRCSRSGRVLVILCIVLLSLAYDACRYVNGLQPSDPIVGAAISIGGGGSLATIVYSRLYWLTLCVCVRATWLTSGGGRAAGAAATLVVLALGVVLGPAVGVGTSREALRREFPYRCQFGRVSVMVEDQEVWRGRAERAARHGCWVLGDWERRAPDVAASGEITVVLASATKLQEWSGSQRAAYRGGISFVSWDDVQRGVLEHELMHHWLWQSNLPRQVRWSAGIQEGLAEAVEMEATLSTVAHQAARVAHDAGALRPVAHLVDVESLFRLSWDERYVQSASVFSWRLALRGLGGVADELRTSTEDWSEWDAGWRRSLQAYSAVSRCGNQAFRPEWPRSNVDEGPGVAERHSPSELDGRAHLPSGASLREKFEAADAQVDLGLFDEAIQTVSEPSLLAMCDDSQRIAFLRLWLRAAADGGDAAMVSMLLSRLAEYDAENAETLVGAAACASTPQDTRALGLASQLASTARLRAIVAESRTTSSSAACASFLEKALLCRACSVGVDGRGSLSLSERDDIQHLATVCSDKELSDATRHEIAVATRMMMLSGNHQESRSVLRSIRREAPSQATAQWAQRMESELDWMKALSVSRH